MNEITIKDLLQHAGGWDSGTGFDPQYAPWTWQEAGVLGVAPPPIRRRHRPRHARRAARLRPRHATAYSNFGYNVLGRVIERVSGQGYGAYVQGRVLAPAGITGMRLSRTRREDRAPGEVRYYDHPGQPPVASVFPGEGFVPDAYGGYFMEALDAHGGWIATASDLVRFALHVDGRRSPSLLTPHTVDLMLTAPLPSGGQGETGAGNAAAASGLGWVVTRDEDGLAWWHTGALTGSTAAWLVSFATGVTLAFAFNSLPQDVGAFFSDALPTLAAAVKAVTAWPGHNLFVGAPPPATPRA